MQSRNYRIKGKILKFYLLTCGCKVGTGLICKRWPIFRTIPKKNIRIGHNVIIGYFVTFDIIFPGTLEIGDHVELSHNILLGSLKSIKIGNYCLIGENVSIRDDNHKTFRGIPISSQGWATAEIIIEDDVWIGAGSLILSGAKLMSGAVIGANSLVLGKSQILSNNIYGGSPVKLIGRRQPE
jgi:acetyltransferase-like isoleucine patch superfamily enzyme